MFYYKMFTKPYINVKMAGKNNEPTFCFLFLNNFSTYNFHVRKYFISLTLILLIEYNQHISHTILGEEMCIMARHSTYVVRW